MNPAVIGRERQGKACDAVLRMIAQREGAAPTDVKCPDQLRKGGVEIVCRIGPRLFALEHTLIESYPDQMLDSVNFGKIIAPLEKMLEGRLPKTGWFWLTVEPNSLQAVRNHQIEQVREAIESWVLERASALKVGQWIRSDDLTGVSFRIWLALDSTPLDYCGRLKVARHAPGDAEQLRRQRINKALSDKLPKLNLWKTENNAVSVLVLEDTDQSLSNCVVAGEAVKAELAFFPMPPDQIYLVDSKASPWTVYLLKHGPLVWPLENSRHWDLSRFDEEKLVDLTRCA